ncbi:MAG: NAD-dependent epimerase/dehydratase family protein [Nitrospira sp.]|nr:NAD-dependent epimerase/dehydratase family protein [Nitrospira sp.]
MKILVTGGAGFVGSHTVDLLLEQGHEVVVVDNLDPQVHGTVSGSPPNLAAHERNARLRFIRGDVRDAAVLTPAMAGVEAVLHLAAAVGVGQSMYQPYHYCSVNEVGTAQVLDVLVNTKTAVRKLVVASSMSIYGEGTYACRTCGEVYPQTRQAEDLSAGKWEIRCTRCAAFVTPLPTGETKPLVPTSIYAIGKKTQEELVLCFGKAYQLPSVALRYFNIYGPRQSLNNPYTGVGAIFMSRLMNGKPPIIFEDGGQSRDFIHVRDIARANVLALTTPGGDYQAMNVGCGRSVSVLQVYQMLAGILNVSIAPTIAGKFRAGDIRHCYSDPSLATRLLGWEPQVKLEEGLRDLVRWSVESGVKPVDRVEQCYQELSEKKLIV